MRNYDNNLESSEMGSDSNEEYREYDLEDSDADTHDNNNNLNSNINNININIKKQKINDPFIRIKIQISKQVPILKNVAITRL
jgi:hypothetical protein